MPKSILPTSCVPVLRLRYIHITNPFQPLDPEHNFTKAASFIRSAAAQGAHLAVLPEYHLTSWVPQEPTFLPLCDQWETYLKKYQALAKECNICIVPGTLVESHRGASSAEDKLLNVAYFISNSGSVVGKYVKKNLWGRGEREHLTSSGRDVHQVFDTPLGKIGLLICWDLAFPEAFRELLSAGVEIVVVPAFWKTTDCGEDGLGRNPWAEGVFLDSVVTARAFENTCVVVFTNAGGPPGEQFVGLSQVAVPFAGPLTRLGSSAEGMSVVDVDMKILEEAEANYGIRADLAREDWHYDYRHSIRDRA
ncbi:carbon-nitrogen hydrolase [Westerdykella ornata]|uniref:Carbon-nitrogen hydrolase n=1 Tax=Westerdykella ornata TaxID=318751 RepID=A0A6A6J6E2_WESOR|nr:carbon-nitrogen hydrolase [Westerdykella ornata]KAF2271784.1 carbon-nitrogen hydrolase [Westerdykella ornata]